MMQALRLSPALRHAFVPRRPPLRPPSRPLSLAPGALPDYRIARRPVADLVADGTRFPWRDEFELGHDLFLNADAVMAALSPLMTAERLARIDAVAARRTFDVLPIVEHPYDMGNVAAVIRTADALGCGAVHVIRKEEDDRYKQSTRTSGGAEKWIDCQLHDSTAECLAQAKALGYQIVATHLRAGAVAPADIDWTRPTAVVFGNELRGVTDEVLEAADACVAISMDGFVESFNMSVAAALVLWEARRVRTAALGAHANLTPEQQRILKAVMVLRTRGMAKQWIAHILRRPPPEWQQYRNRGDWKGKEFAGVGEEGGLPAEEGEDGAERGKFLPAAGKRRKCFYWDGETCWGEQLVFPGKMCLYHRTHTAGSSSINWMKLEEGCGRVGVPAPEIEALKARLKEQREAVKRAAQSARDRAVSARGALERAAAAAAAEVVGAGAK